MKYTPAAIPTADLDIVKAPYFGGEFQPYMTQVPSVNIGEVDLTATGAGTWTADPATSIKTGGADLAINAITPILSTVACVVVFNCLDGASPAVPCLATGTFAPSARSTNQTYNFPRGV